jgi:plastocyanin
MTVKVVVRKGNSAINSAYAGEVGEITYDSDNKTIRIHDGTTLGGAKAVTNIIAGNNVTVSNVLGEVTINAITAGSSNSFSIIEVAGQPSVIADSITDTLTLVAGPNISLITNASGDTITISATSSGNGGASGVSAGTQEQLAYYASNGSVIQATGSGLTWNNTNLNITGTVTATGDVSYIRAYFDTLVALQTVSAVTWHGMVAHVHENGGRMYYAHGGAWKPMSNFSDLNMFETIAVAGQTSVVADSSTDTLTLVAGNNVSITTNANTDTITINATGGGGSSNSFETIVVAGQTSVVADSSTDTLTLVAGNNVSITTNANTDTITINATGGAAGNLDSLTDVVLTSPSVNQVLKYNGTNWINDTDATGGGGSSNSFETIAVAGQTSIVADSSTDTLTLVAGTGINITTVAGTDTITIASSVSSGATTFTGLSDVSTSGLTVDRIYLPAITMLAVTASGSSAYLFDQYSGSNPTIYAISGTTIAFDLSVGLSSHPFLIRTSGGVNYNTGLVHVTNGGVVTTGSSAQGKTSGTLYWKIPASTTGNYQYICQNHGSMVGVITIKDITAI